MAGSDPVSGVLLFAPDAEVSGFKAVAVEGSDAVMVHWDTAMEEGVNAFRLERHPADGNAVVVGQVRARGFESGYKYEISDPSVHRGDSVHYDLFLVTRYGDQQVAAWDGVVESVPAPVRPEMTTLVAEAVAESLPVSERKCWIGNGDRVKIWTNSLPADRIRFSLTEEGVYTVTAREIADAGGWNFSEVTNALATTNLAMSCQGDPVAWHPLDDGLIFHGLPAASRWAPENVYWIEFGSGLNMATIDATPPENGTTNAWFMDHLFVQGTEYLSRVGYSTLADVPVSYLSFNPGHFLSGSSRTVDVVLNDCAEGDWTGTVAIDLMSVWEVGSDVHTSQVAMASTTLGEHTWSGEQYVPLSYPFSSTNLAGETASLQVSNVSISPPIGVDDYTRFMWISCAVDYPRQYIARDGALKCAGGPDTTVVVSGFSANDVLVLDVTATNHPILVDSIALSLNPVTFNWAVAFACGDSDTVYQVCSKAVGLRLPSIRGVQDVDWSSPDNAADYVILIPPEGWKEGFLAPMQELADYRSAQGLQTTVVDVELLYNRYSYGLVDPDAIKAFCSAGVSNWTERPLRYLLLCGDGGLDFKHTRFSVDDYVACLIPPIIVGQRFSSGEANSIAIDGAYGDVDGDGIPEIAIGRLPTPYASETEIIVNKTIQYESAIMRDDDSLAKLYVAIAPDWTNVPGSVKYYPFDAAVDRLIASLEGAGRICVPCRANPEYPNNLSYAKINSLIPALDAGIGIFDFFGHSNKRDLGISGWYEGLPGSKLFINTDITTNNWQRPTIATWIGCQPNVWHWLTTSPTTMVEGVFKPGTGFVAGLGATGFLLADEGEELGVYLYDQLTDPSIVRLGDALRETYAVAINDPSNPYIGREEYIIRLLCFGLTGDPALVFRHDVTAMGTDVEWLVAHGQVNANADLEDPDGDGWATWREFAGDTNPTNYVLQFAGVQVDWATGEPQLSFETSASRTYQVLYSPTLSESNDWQLVDWARTPGVGWNPAESNIVPTGPVTSVVLPAVTNQGYFRIQEN